mgnify:CR=1 FL=1
MKRNLILAAVLVAVVGFGVGLELWKRLHAPFALGPFLAFAEEKGYLVEPTPAFAELAAKQGFRVNERPPLDGSNIARRALLIDAERLADGLLTPAAYARFARENLLNSGMAFACHQFVLVDGGILDRSMAAFASGMAGLPEGAIKSMPGTPEDALLFLFSHEAFHVVDFDYRLSQAEEAAARRHFEDGNALLAQRDYAAAEAQFRQAIEICPADYKSWDQMAIAARRKGDAAAAADRYRTSLAINPGGPLARRNILIPLIEQQELDEARRIAEENQSMLDQNGEDDYWLATIAAMQERDVDAFRHYGEARRQYMAVGSGHAVEVAVRRLQLLRRTTSLGDLESLVAELAEACRAVSPAPEFLATCASATKSVRR